MNTNSFVIKGDICYSSKINELLTFENQYLICIDGISAGVFKSIPEEYSELKVFDYSGLLVIPGLIDLHTHAAQYFFRGLGMDNQLMEWLNNYAFPAESRFSNIEYAKAAYAHYADVMKHSATTRACIFSSVHVPATEILMDMMENTGLRTFIGKVNMDRNCPEYLVEDTDQSAADTDEWIVSVSDRYKNTKPILTPRFIPTCSDRLMLMLRKIQEKYGLPLQSHISENVAEIELVKQLCPNSEFYGDAYDSFKLFGNDVPTIMAHCVLSEENELQRIKKNGVYIAHCPQSNANLASGVAPVRRFLDMDLHCGLGSDVAGCSSVSIFRAMSDAIQMSKLRWRLYDDKLKPLTIEEAFYLGTKGGGEFFGKVGSFESGYELDAIILNDEPPKYFGNISLKDRLERFIHLSNGNGPFHKFVSGTQIF